MGDEADLKDLAILSDKLIGMSSDSGITRWAPLVVVLSVVGGFVALSWYAYHAGIQSVKEEDLVVVEADKTPIKEKPSDPGGMQFPNQDKTVFETFSGNARQPAKVERVLPVPEEPMPKDNDASDTTTWVNESLPKKGIAEQVIGRDINKKGDERMHIAPSITAADEKSTFTGSDEKRDPQDHQIIAAQPSADEEQSITYVAPKNASATKPAEKPITLADTKNIRPFAPDKAAVLAKGNYDETERAHVSPKAEDKPQKPVISKAARDAADKELSGKPVPHKPETKTAVKEAHIPSSGNAMVQLGAYRSQQEADDAWTKMHLKQKLLSDKRPTVLKVNLGSKGIYYRLRVGISSASEAKSFCHALSSSGQPCIIPTEK